MMRENCQSEDESPESGISQSDAAVPTDEESSRKSRAYKKRRRRPKPLSSVRFAPPAKKGRAIDAELSMIDGKPPSPANEKKCPKCRHSKPRPDFSATQWKHKTGWCSCCVEKKNKSSTSLEKVSKAPTMRIMLAKESGVKFLATVVPHCGDTSHNEELPSELLLDGYTRDDWSTMTDETDSGLWRSLHLRSVDGKRYIPGFLDFLKERKKAAYGTFLLPDGTDGFLCVPFQQPAPPGNRDKFIFCKYVLGMNLVSKPKAEPDGGADMCADEPSASLVQEMPFSVDRGGQMTRTGAVPRPPSGHVLPSSSTSVDLERSRTDVADSRTYNTSCSGSHGALFVGTKSYTSTASEPGWNGAKSEAQDCSMLQAPNESHTCDAPAGGGNKLLSLIGARRKTDEHLAAVPQTQTMKSRQQGNHLKKNPLNRTWYGLHHLPLDDQIPIEYEEDE